MRIYFEGPIFVMVFIVGVSLIWLRFSKEPIRFFFLSSFYLYICLLIRYTQFPITLFTHVPFKQNMDEVINIVPLINLNRTFINYILNIFMTIPFGFIFPLIRKISSKKMIFWSIFVPIIIEGGQLLQFFLTSYSERIIDINDILMNTLGIWIGYFLYHILVFYVEKYIKMNNDVKKSSIISFIIHHHE
ncbi:antibiotic resistance protein VanZ [Anoxybacillus ayderensis]|uniref:VanZ family protein n=2 Tax=Anoxybacillus TaxID=150247 RepID=UPI00036D9E86|nr:antibiotic resistance protein VanZ [Anoxybacillus ayderensis G10]MBW9218991.1 VanZ family protein [Anoxybacillus sp. ST70]THD15900.1 antibiotic resistance protein VanZ [Anoxybacillus ayderensis]